VSTAFSNEGFRWTDTVQNMSYFGTMQYGTLRTAENTENGTVESRRATAAELSKPQKDKRTRTGIIRDTDAVRRATAAGLNLATATNSAAAPFATDFFAYDSQNRVIRHDVQGAGCSSCTGGIKAPKQAPKGQA